MNNTLKFLYLTAISFTVLFTPIKSAAAFYSKEISRADSTSGERIKHVRSPSPRTAAKLAVIPGLGQVYNRDFWKIPIVYGSLGGSLVAIHLNSIKYQDFLKAYLGFYNLGNGSLSQGVTADTRMPVVVRNLFNTKSVVKLYTRDQVARQKDVWRRYRNVSVLISGMIYLLSIIEANVAAHLKGFDVSDDLSIQIQPQPVTLPGMMSGANIRIVLSYK
ncbi:DUF5683 domain-containing protein [Dyadobacter sandarakinus]|uniref:DUF5683 domain-containing protein n=1 Tax=Dyadobacter sandarakinus TaxID=2747268 RepID=A0ABX7ICC9_9BACT|nr:DUF5683 domain-containing protein [Dyadobacter sandarakinus]QRR03187.1 hypothetical protein HWI92_20855 [Dyadobacter sandarakinus]